MRSDKIQGLHASAPERADGELKNVYKVYWGASVLNGVHHELLDPKAQHISEKTPGFPAAELWHGCLIDVGKVKAGFRDGDSSPIIEELLADSLWKALPGSVCLLINPAYTDKEISQEVLEAVARHRTGMSENVTNAWRNWRYTKSIDITAWIDYLHCYDLKISGNGYGAVGKEVYGGAIPPLPANVARMRNRAKQGVKQVLNLIEAAECTPNGPWPPSPEFLAKRPTKTLPCKQLPAKQL
ncbi:MAG: hypothetical protein QM706_08790 [Nitrospira sp.]